MSSILDSLSLLLVFCLLGTNDKSILENTVGALENDQLNHSVHGACIDPLCPDQNTRTTNVSYASSASVGSHSLPFLLSSFPPSKLTGTFWISVSF